MRPSAGVAGRTGDLGAHLALPPRSIADPPPTFKVCGRLADGPTCKASLPGAPVLGWHGRDRQPQCAARSWCCPYATDST